MRTLRMLFLACVAVMAFGAIAASSASAIEWLVKTAKESGKLEADATGATTLTDESSGEVLECLKSATDGTLNEGLIKGTDIGDITMASWTECESKGSLAFKFTVNPLTLTEPWLVLAVAHENNEDLIWLLIHSHITHLTSSFGCNFLVSGLAIGLYHQSSLLLLFGKTVNAAGTANEGLASTLTVSNSSGCLGIINNGDKSVFEGAYKALEHVSIKLGP